MNLFLVSFLFVASAWSQTIDQISHPCGRDFKIWCKNERVLPSKYNQFRCFNSRYTELSPECQSFISKAMIGTPCGKEIVERCQGQDRNLARVTACLQRNKNFLGSECQSLINKNSTTKSKLSDACDDDFQVCSEKLSRSDGANCRVNLYKEKKLSKKCYEVMTPLLKRRSA